MPRQNLISNPSFETSYNTGWTGGPAPFPSIWNRETNPTYGVPVSNAGSFYTYLNRNSTGDIWLRSAQFPVTVGASYTASGYINRDGTTKCAIGFEFYNASGGAISSTAAESFPANATWTRLSTTQAAPANAATADVYFYVTGQAANFYWRLDAVLVELGSVLNAYADGDTPGWLWDGTPGTSTSREANIAATAFFPYMEIA